MDLGVWLPKPKVELNKMSCCGQDACEVKLCSGNPDPIPFMSTLIATNLL